MLELFVFLQTDDAEQEEGEICFQQDSIPTHFSHEVLNALYVRFPNWWIGRGRHVKSRLLTVRFFLWGFVKNLIYAEKIQFYIICERKLTHV
jgi:hypothetical protein